MCPGVVRPLFGSKRDLDASQGYKSISCKVIIDYEFYH